MKWNNFIKEYTRIQIDLIAIMNHLNKDSKLTNKLLTILTKEENIIKMCNFLMNNVNISNDEIINKAYDLSRQEIYK